MANQLTTDPKLEFSAFMTSDAVKSRVNQLIGGEKGTRFISTLVSAVKTNPTLANCEKGSLLNCALLAASLDLSPSPQLGQFYLVPFKGVATPQVGYRGYIQLAIRSGQYRRLNVMEVKEGELLRYNPADEEIELKLMDDPEAREKAKTIGYYAMFEYTNGFRKAIYWSRARAEAHGRKYSQSFSRDGSPWQAHFDAMAKKSLIRELLGKWGVMSIDMQTAIVKDAAVLDAQGEVAGYVDTPATPAPEAAGNADVAATGLNPAEAAIAG
ncbi:hypothetical protein FACS1894186_5820 [Alphaproteobacteria bacterium]|nr:hypothetical protein FACS1894186_5820 [Alphaproteobacteria bacterium]